MPVDGGLILINAIETKVLKQRVRDHIQPDKDLGHSDVGGKKREGVKGDVDGQKSEDDRGAKVAPREDSEQVGRTEADEAGGAKCEDCA